jgi:hypothetical protein
VTGPLDWTGYAFELTVADGGPDTIPVHIAQKVLIDGKPVAGVRSVRVAAERDEHGMDATTVTLEVDVERVAVPHPYDPTTTACSPGAIDGHAVLTPVRDWTYDEESGLVTAHCFFRRITFE